MAERRLSTSGKLLLLVRARERLCALCNRCVCMFAAVELWNGVGVTIATGMPFGVCADIRYLYYCIITSYTI